MGPMESVLAHQHNPTTHPTHIRGTCFDTDGTTSSSQGWRGGATLCTAMHLHSHRKCLHTNTGMPGLFWSHWSLLSTSDYIGGDDIIVENSCRSKAASWDNDCVFIVVDLNVGNCLTDWLTDWDACTTHFVLSLFQRRDFDTIFRLKRRCAVWWCHVYTETQAFIVK